MNKAEFIDSIQFIKTLNATKIINGLLLRLSYIISKYFTLFIHWGKPEFISIEPTNLCNLKCPECPSGNNNMLRPRLFLSENDYTNNINQIAKHLSYLQLFFQGEPFMHPKLFDFISYATSKDIYTSTSTNGQFLGLENCHKIIDSGLHRILISVDGTTQETYQKYRVGGSLEQVISGITNILEVKKRLQSSTPFVIMQFVVTRSNEHQIDQIKQLAASLKVDKLQIKSAQIENFEGGNALIPLNKKYSRYQSDKNGKFWLKRKANFKCKRLWMGSVISAQNELLPCCFDKNAEHSYGKLSTNKISKQWKTSNAHTFRVSVWKNYKSHKMCKNCTEGLSLK